MALLHIRTNDALIDGDGTVIDGESMDATYWGQNIRYPVQFAQSIKALSEQGFRIFVEIGPHPALGLSIEQCLGKEPLILASMRREQNIHDVSWKD